MAKGMNIYFVTNKKMINFANENVQIRKRTKKEMKIVLIDEEEQMAFQLYAKQIGIPLNKWFDDMWVSAFSVIKGLGKNDAVKELKRRSDGYNCCSVRER